MIIMQAYPSIASVKGVDKIFFIAWCTWTVDTKFREYVIVYS